MVAIGALWAFAAGSFRKGLAVTERRREECGTCAAARPGWTACAAKPWRSPAMTTELLPSDGVVVGGSARRLSDRLRCLASWLVSWRDTCADYSAAAARYEQLSALSDAELARRGLSRTTLARDLCCLPRSSDKTKT
jgi:hypothetical protein